MPGTITEDGEPVNYVVHYFRLGRERRERSDSLSAAFWSMLSGADNGMCAPEDIESADGHVLIDRATLQALFEQARDAHDEDREFDLDEALMRMQPAAGAGHAAGGAHRPRVRRGA